VSGEASYHITGVNMSLDLQQVDVSRQSAHEGDKVVIPTHRPPLPPRRHSWYSFLSGAESTPGS